MKRNILVGRPGAIGKIAEAFGLDPTNLVSFTFHCALNDVAIIKAEYLSEDIVDNVSLVVKQYHLESVEDLEK